MSNDKLFSIFNALESTKNNRKGDKKNLLKLKREEIKKSLQANKKILNQKD